MAERTVQCAKELKAACDAARPGDVILVHAGSYHSSAPAVLKGVQGTRDEPVRIRPAFADQGWILGGAAPNPFAGESHPAEAPPDKPVASDFCFLFVTDCAHVVIEGLKLRDFWPSIISIKDSRYVTVRNCTLRHGTYAVFAKGDKTRPETTSHLLIEGNEWQQDDSPDHALWTRIDWARAHGGEGSDGLFRYFNGGFLSTKNVRGQVILRGNRIMDAYNGVRMKVDEGLVPAVTDLPKANADVHIYDNDFIRIRDNPVEPEVAAYNWHVRHNRLLDCHSWFSVDGVRGGYWYFCGNTGRFESRQGEPGKPGHTMGRVLKLSYRVSPDPSGSERVPDFPWFVFNNSWHLRCPIVGGAAESLPAVGEGPDFTAKLDFFNNAFTWCDEERDGAWLCEWIEMLRYFDLAKSPGTTFDYDICNRKDFFDELARQRHAEPNGLPAKRPIFMNPAAGNFALASSSEAENTGAVRKVRLAGLDAKTESTTELLAQANGKLNRGALQDYGRIQAPELEEQAARLLAELAGSE